VKEDLSNWSYEEFLVLYKKCISEGFRTLKEGSYFVIVVGDIHENGKYISISNDTDKIAEEVGFIKHDENIYDRGSNIGMDLNPVTFLEKCRRFGTVHEYILIYKKPENSKNPAPTISSWQPEETPQPVAKPKNSTICEDCGGKIRVQEFRGKFLCEGCRYVLGKQKVSEINFEEVL
jgi:hypothetical protein